MPVIGLREFHTALETVAHEAEAASQRSVTRMAAMVEAAVKGNFQGSHAKGDPHVQTSPPRPNVVSGTLRRSVRSDPIQRRGVADFATQVGPRTIYARAVEKGIRPGSAAYPYFEPGVEHERPKFPGVAAEEWRKFLH